MEFKKPQNFWVKWKKNMKRIGKKWDQVVEMTAQEMRASLEKQLEKLPFFISTKDTADFLGISKSNLIKKTETGEIKSIRNGKLIKIPKECLIEYVLNAM